MKQNFIFRQTVLTRCVLAACGASAAVLAVQPVFAQTAAPALQRVEITGSNIKRVDAETASPVQIVTREEIERSGKNSVAELLQSLAVDNAGSVPMTFGNGFAKGASGISLRGLGVASTLVLINGRRIAPYGNADDGQKIFADLNVIPTEAVERVEILKDGASAIYGSDAIAGVVNIVLRRDFKGTVAKGSIGTSQAGGGQEGKASITHGFGDLDQDKFNVLLNLEVGKVGDINNRDRSGRGQIGKSDGRAIGYNSSGTIGNFGAGGTGAITGNNAAGSSTVGNVRNPTTLDYFSRGNPAGAGFVRTYPGANCANFSSIPQGGDRGGCLIDSAQQYGQIQPSQETLNFFGRFTKEFNAGLQVYSELNLYSSKSDSSTTPSGISASVGFPGGPVSNAAVALGATHPDNPYNAAARFRYLAADVGQRTSRSNSDFNRFVVGLKGTAASWDFDTAFLYSSSKGKTERGGYLQKDVTFALLNPSAANVAAANAGSAAYRALPVGSVWRVAENAGLNSAALYAALAPTISDTSKTTTTQIDFKASREFGQLAGGAIGLALGAEFRNESNELTPTTGTERGNIIGLGYSSYKSERNVAGVFSEVNLPITKTLEVQGALRVDKYPDLSASTTPKLGAKWTPTSGLVLRSTYAEGFRAPGAAEKGTGISTSFFTTAVDPVRCNLGVTTACSAQSVAGLVAANPNLKPETSKNVTLGVVWEPSNNSNISMDLWQVVRKNEINTEQAAAAIAAGSVSRDPSTSQVAGDPGVITAILERYINSTQTKVVGLDLDARHRIDLSGGNGKLTFGAQWTHLLRYLRTDDGGVTVNYAGTHGNCDVTNCIGTPKDRLNFSVNWEQGSWNVTGIVAYRGKLDNVLFKNDPAGCASSLANGTDSPSGCAVKSFASVDLNLRYKLSPKTQIFGTIRNLLDSVAPFDPTTYGAVGYNPLDYAGAVGRYFSVGVRHQF